MSNNYRWVCSGCGYVHEAPAGARPCPECGKQLHPDWDMSRMDDDHEGDTSCDGCGERVSKKVFLLVDDRRLCPACHSEYYGHEDD